MESVPGINPLRLGDENAIDSCIGTVQPGVKSSSSMDETENLQKRSIID